MIALPLLLCLGLSAPAHAGKTERVSKLMEASVAAYKQGDLFKAIDKIDRAIKIAPGSQELRWARVQLLSRLLQTVDGAAATLVDTEVNQECARIANLDPDSGLGKLALGLLRKVSTAELFPEPSTACSDEAKARVNQAELLFGRDDMAGARRAYDEALALCPDNAIWWTWSGDAAFSLGAIQDALADYEHALSLEPCYWVAHRFAADVIFRTDGDRRQVYDHLVSAVACNPTYDLAWNDLEGLVGPGWRRELLSPPADPSRVSISASGSGEDATKALIAAAPWIAWSAQMEVAEGSALTRYRGAARAGLGLIAPMLAEDNGATYGVWSLLAEADAADQLDAALFLLSDDTALLSEYLAWRAEHPGESEALIRTLLAPYGGP